MMEPYSLISIHHDGVFIAAYPDQPAEAGAAFTGAVLDDLDNADEWVMTAVFRYGPPTRHTGQWVLDQDAEQSKRLGVTPLVELIRARRRLEEFER